MDKVRFGRALGKGTRAAAQSLWEAADAAATPDPRKTGAGQQRPVSAGVQGTAGRLIEAHQAVQGTKRQVRGAAKVAGRSVLAPVKKFSSVLWLEVTGTFFALVAAFLATGLWRMRAAVHAAAGSPAGQRFWVCVMGFLVFGYFAVSSFVRARRRSRG